MTYSEMYFNESFRKDWESMTEDEKNCMKISVPVSLIERWINGEAEITCNEYYMAIKLMQKNQEIQRLLSYGF